ncbi:MAG: RhuM family protein [Xanthobacteraceae bacterium]|nr:virulence RhuM family protein [Hyphomicrobiales bacterium]
MADRKPDKDSARATQEILRIGGGTKSASARTPIIGDGDEAVTGDVLLIYGTDRGIKIDIIYQEDTLWMTQKQMADLFSRDVSVISRHVSNIIAEGELPEEGNLQKMQIGLGKPTTLYSVDMVISVGYRVSSKQATQFRMWATERLKEIVLRGWSIDADRLKKSTEQNRITELRDTIRDIRASEVNIYREVRSICAMCRDYDPHTDAWRNFYAGMQNKLLWAITQMTAPELIMQRANADHPNMGLRAWANDNVRKSDVTIANNYLVEPEIKEKNRFATMLLDYFEDQLDQGRLVTMVEAEGKMDEFIKFNNRPLLTHMGSVKRSTADTHAETQYKIFAEKRRAIRHQQE